MFYEFTKIGDWQSHRDSGVGTVRAALKNITESDSILSACAVVLSAKHKKKTN